MAASDPYVVGAVIAGRAEGPTVEGVLPDSPADRVGLRQGDAILEIDGVSTVGSSLADCLHKLKSSRAEPVRILIDRGGDRLGFLVNRERLGDILARADLAVEGEALVPSSEYPEVRVGSAAPTVQGTDLYTGREVGLGQFEGTKVLLVFWTSWCQSCIETIPTLREARQLPGVKLSIVGINLDENVEGVREFLRSRPFGDVQIHDGGWFGPNSLRFRAYRAGVPFYVLVDGDGRVAEPKLRPEAILDAVREPF